MNFRRVVIHDLPGNSEKIGKEVHAGGSFETEAHSSACQDAKERTFFQKGMLRKIS